MIHDAVPAPRGAEPEATPQATRQRYIDAALRDEWLTIDRLRRRLQLLVPGAIPPQELALLYGSASGLMEQLARLCRCRLVGLPLMTTDGKVLAYPGGVRVEPLGPDVT